MSSELIKSLEDKIEELNKVLGKYDRLFDIREQTKSLLKNLKDLESENVVEKEPVVKNLNIDKPQTQIELIVEVLKSKGKSMKTNEIYQEMVKQNWPFKGKTIQSQQVAVANKLKKYADKKEFIEKKGRALWGLLE